MPPDHRDYSATPLAKKLGIREGSRVLVGGAPEGFELGPLPGGIERLGRAGRDMDVVVVFVATARDLRRRFGALARGLAPTGRLWVAWPKKASGLTTDLDFGSVQRTGLDAGLVDNKSASLSDEYQGVQFVYRLRDRPARA